MLWLLKVYTHKKACFVANFMGVIFLCSMIPSPMCSRKIIIVFIAILTIFLVELHFKGVLKVRLLFNKLSNLFFIDIFATF